MIITAENGKVIIDHDGKIISVELEQIPSLIGRLARAALDAKHQEAMLED